MRQLEDQQRQAVAAEAMLWFGTPYHHHARLRGVGTDCAQLLCDVFESCGLVPPVEPGFYPHDWHLHRGEELFLHWLRHAGATPTDNPKTGDVAVFRYGRAYSHGAIAVDGPGLVLHAYIGRGVILSRLDEDPLAGRPPMWWTLWPRGELTRGR